MKDVLKQLARDLKAEKLRTFLTIFGIVWGTVAISLMLAFGTGLHKQLIKSTAGLGDRIVIAWPGLTSIPYEGLGKGRRIRIREDDLDRVRGNVPGLKAISGEYSNNMKVVYGTKTLSVDTSGVVPEFGAMRNLIPQMGGRFIDAIDFNEQRRVAFLGNKLAKDIFGATPRGRKDDQRQPVAVPRRRRAAGEGSGLELQRPRRPEDVHPVDDVPRAHRRQVRRQLRLPGRERRATRSRS